MIATDAAVDEYRAARAFLATSGHWATEGHIYTRQTGGVHRVAASEMGAVHLALSQVLRELPDITVTVCVDSTEALGWMRAWQAGGTVLPAGYPAVRRQGQPSTLVRLQLLLHTRHSKVIFRQISAHTGHPLNEAADSMAKLALRASRGNIDHRTAKGLPPVWAVQRLEDYRRSRRSARGA